MHNSAVRTRTDVSFPKKVTVIGLGNMGSALADALLRCGHEVVVWNRTASRADALVAKGAVLATSPADAIHAAPVAIICLTDHSASTAVLEMSGVAESIANRTLVQLTSALPEDAVAQDVWTRRHGGRFIAGGIMAFPKDIGRPDTSFFYSGDEAAFRTHRDVLLAMGGDLKFLGTNPGVALAVYITSGLYMLGSLAMFLETAAVAAHYGISIEKYCDFALATTRVLHDRVRESTQRITEDRFDGDEATIDMVVPTLEEHCRRFALAGIEPRMTAAFVKHLQAAASHGRGQCDIAALVQRADSHGANPGERVMTAAQVEAELRAVLDEVESAYARGVPPAELMPMWYDQSDVVVVGQGESCASRGFPAALAQAIQKTPLIGERPQVAFRIDSPIVVADGLAVAMIDCDAVPDYPAADRMQLRLLTAWCRRPDGWRIVREMFSEGSL